MTIKEMNTTNEMLREEIAALRNYKAQVEQQIVMLVDERNMLRTSYDARCRDLYEAKKNLTLADGKNAMMKETADRIITELTAENRAMRSEIEKLVLNQKETEPVAPVTERPEIVDDEHLQYLDDLRESGATNMYGARPYLMDEFGLTKKEGSTVLSYWMTSYGERHPNAR